MRKHQLIVIFSLICLICFVPSMSSANPRFLADSSIYTVDVIISDAYYADLDLDENLDDIAIFIDLFANFEGRFRATLVLAIELPSGLTHRFLLEAWLNINGIEPVKLKVTTLNTASEAGWYTVNLEGQIRGLPFGSFSTDSSLIFDPPTGVGNGDPTASVMIL